MAFKFEVRHHGTHDKLGLATILQEFVDEEWVAEHMTTDQAARVVIDRFA